MTNKYINDYLSPYIVPGILLWANHATCASKYEPYI